VAQGTERVSQRCSCRPHHAAVRVTSLPPGAPAWTGTVPSHVAASLGGKLGCTWIRPAAVHLMLRFLKCESDNMWPKSGLDLQAAPCAWKI
jgi:hypothetical protein